MNSEIPKWGWYNAQVLFELSNTIENSPNMSVSEFMSDFRKRKLNGIPFPLKNQGTAISLLYMVLVVPQQLWKSRGNDMSLCNIRPLFDEIESLVQYKEENELDALLRHLRNSISHARFEIDKNGIYQFKDYDRNKNETFKAKIQHTNLFKLAELVGSYYINTVYKSMKS